MVDMAHTSLVFIIGQFASLILCFRRSKVAGVMGSLVLTLGWVFCLPLMAALVRVEEPNWRCEGVP